MFPTASDGGSVRTSDFIVRRDPLDDIGGFPHERSPHQGRCPHAVRQFVHMVCERSMMAAGGATEWRSRTACVDSDDLSHMITPRNQRRHVFHSPMSRHCPDQRARLQQSTTYSASALMDSNLARVKVLVRPRT